MGYRTENIDADGVKNLGNANASDGKDRFFATIFCQGGGGNNFGSGTVAITISADGGTTKIPALKPDGTALTFSANGAQNIELGFGTSQTQIQIYATMTGSTAPNVDLFMFDNAS